jgi:hypothetical protein
MFIARCQKCSSILGAIRDPSRFSWIRCIECGFNNYITWAIDPTEHYDDSREKMVHEREMDLGASGVVNINRLKIF